MNIFYIPSWYPSQNSPNAGIFFKEQVLNIGKLYPSNKIFINLWGHEDFTLHPQNPLTDFKKINRRFKTRSYIKPIASNVWEVCDPRLSWSSKIFNGNIANIVSASKNNFEKIAEKFGPIDLIHAQVSFPAGYISWKLSKKFKIPYLISEHMGPFPFDEYLQNGKLPKIIREPLKHAQALTAVSSSLKKQMEKFGIRNIEIVPNMVDENFFSLSPKKKFRKKFIFFSLSENSKNKGTGDLIEVIHRLVKKRNDVEFRLGGPGKDLKKYQKMVKSLGLEKNIKWLGQISREKVRAEMHQADVFILPSHFESFSMVTAEALVCGLPVIATRCGGPESMINTDSGFLVDIGNIDGMVENILKIMNNKTSYKSSKIRSEFLKKFSKKITAAKINNIYKKICVE